MSTATTFTLTTLLSVSILGCGYTKPVAAEGGTGGLELLNEGPVEVESPPQWICRERARANEILPGYDDPTEVLETCYYSPHAKDKNGDGQPDDPSWTYPGKPHPGGSPDVTIGWGPNDNGDTHPVYTWGVFGQTLDENDEGYGFHHGTVNSSPHLPFNLDEFRSGLIFNFALWTDGVPDSGLRPPIVTASFINVLDLDIPTLVGHPFLEGRYNAGGMPCSTVPPYESNTSGFSSLVTARSYSESAECAALIEFYSVVEAHALYPLNGSQDFAEGVATDETQCQDNGGVYKMSQAILSSNDRNGLVWLNWGDGEQVVDWLLWLQSAMSVNLQALLVWTDALQLSGWESWPLDPPYPYQAWSSTGTCAHPVRLATVNGQVVTATPCPSNMVAILPDFSIEQALDEENFSGVYGYCTFPHQVAPPPGAALTTPIDVIKEGALGQGFTGALYVDMWELDDDRVCDIDVVEACEDLSNRIGDWMDAIRLEETPKGVVVYPLSELGVNLLDAFNVPDGSTLIGINHLSFITADGRPTTTTIVDAGVEVIRAINSGGFIFALFDTPDGRRLHRYVVPYFD